MGCFPGSGRQKGMFAGPRATCLSDLWETRQWWGICPGRFPCGDAGLRGCWALSQAPFCPRLQGIVSFPAVICEAQDAVSFPAEFPEAEREHAPLQQQPGDPDDVERVTQDEGR